jgi:hypothetical protein
MKKNLIIFLTFIGLIALLPGCEKDGTIVVMKADPTAPAIVTMPDLTLKRTQGTSILEFIGTPVDPGFHASATYFLEACAKGNNFKDSILIMSDIQDTLMKISVSNLNGILLKKFPADQVSAVDFRIRSVLSIDAGTGAKPMIYRSEVISANVTIYGLPRLDLINSGIVQKIESPLGDGKYSGFVKLDKTKAFTLKDPDANIVYGDNAGKLAVNGAAITPADNGWFKLAADTKALTYKTDSYMVGLVGSATPNAWNSPDQKMDYNAQSGTWKITITLVDGEFKFRLNDGWSTNWGGTKDNLVYNGANIAVTAGNYTISLTITNDTAGSNTGTFTIVKN